jgi:hypothetical protein
MRSAITTMLIAAGLATAAVAQTPANAPTVAPTPSAAPAPAPADIGPAPATTADPTPAAAPPEPVLPTTGDGAEIAMIVQNVCVPLVKGGNIDQLTAAAGMKKVKKRGLVNYVTLLGGVKGYTLTLDSQGSNKDVCSITLNYAINGEKPIIEALNIWAYLHDPYMPVQRNDFIPATDYKRITNSWEHYTDHESQGLVFLQLKKPDGTPVSDKYDLATLLYSERKF